MDNFILFIYNFIFHSAFLALLPLLLAASLFVKKFRAGFFNYFGLFFPAQLKFIKRAHENRMNFYLIHGVSVGEIKLSRFVMSEILKTDKNAVFALTSTSLDSFAEAGKMQFENRVLPLFFPLDLPLFMHIFLKSIAPRAIYILEVDLWPNFIIAAAMKGIPIRLLNGRVSPKTYNFYKKVPAFIKSILSLVSDFFMQTGADAEKIIELGADATKVKAAGNMKFDLSKNSANPEHIAALNEKIEKFFSDTYDFTFTAGSTHADEEIAVINALSAALAARPGFRTLCLIAPRDVSRAHEISLKLENACSVAIMSEGNVKGRQGSENNAGGIDVMVIDAMGFLTAAYAISDAAFVGGTLSLKDVGGHNIIEPAAFGIPVIFGKNIRNFADVSLQLKESPCVFEVRGESEIKEAISRILAPEYAYVNSIGSKKLIEIVSENSDVTPKIFSIIKEHQWKSATSRLA